MVIVQMDEPIADLVLTVQERLKKKGDMFSVMDAAQIRADWEKKWKTDAPDGIIKARNNKPKTPKKTP